MNTPFTLSNINAMLITALTTMTIGCSSMAQTTHTATNSMTNAVSTSTQSTKQSAKKEMTMTMTPSQFATPASQLKIGENKVTYMSEGEKVVGLLYIPESYQSGQKLPAIIVNPPASGIKEQTAGQYAQELAKKGFITLSIDPRGFGESEGEPLLLNAYKMAEDIRNGISYLESLPQVNTNNTFSLGICAGAGFAGYATAFDPRIEALAVVSPFLTTKEEMMELVGNNSKVLRERVMPATAIGYQKLYAGDAVPTTPPVPTTEQEIANARPIPLGMRDYYLAGKAGDHPRWQNALSVRSAPYVLSFSIFDYTNMFDGVPTVVVYGDQADSAQGAQRFYDEIKGEKALTVVKGAGHFDLYWKPEYVSQAVDSIDDFLKNKLNN